MSKEKKPMKKKTKFIIVLVIELVILLLVAGAAIAVKWGMNFLDKNIQRDEEFDEEELDMPEIQSEKIDNYTNIAVFGVDSRKNVLEKGLSDMIMVVSINNQTKDVKVVSVYRDSYLLVDPDKDKFDKATHAYNGGPTKSVNMLNNNFDLNITDYVTVNFEAVYQAVDAVGGVDIEIDSKEQSDINRYIEELNQINGTNSPYIYKTGVLHLDGIQATAYGRLRYIDSDYARTERQREVLMELFNKVKNSNVAQLKKLVELLAPKVLTSLTNTEILDLAMDVASYDIVDQTGFPFELKGSTIGGVWYAVPNNLELSVKQLHAYLFDDEEYEPSENVKKLSEELDDKIGREPNTETTFTLSKDAEDTGTTKAAEKTSEKDSSK